jgi:hypothetical protein
MPERWWDNFYTICHRNNNNNKNNNNNDDNDINNDDDYDNNNNDDNNNNNNIIIIIIIIIVIETNPIKARPLYVAEDRDTQFINVAFVSYARETQCLTFL